MSFVQPRALFWDCQTNCLIWFPGVPPLYATVPSRMRMFHVSVVTVACVLIRAWIAYRRVGSRLSVPVFMLVGIVSVKPIVPPRLFVPVISRPPTIPMLCAGTQAAVAPSYCHTMSRSVVTASCPLRGLVMTASRSAVDVQMATSFTRQAESYVSYQPRSERQMRRPANGVSSARCAAESIRRAPPSLVVYRTRVWRVGATLAAGTMARTTGMNEEGRDGSADAPAELAP